MDESPTLRFGVMLLAAGASRRMGRPKLLMTWDGQSVIARVACSFDTAGVHQIAAVHARDDRALQAELRQIGVSPILNPDAPEADMFSSICHGITWSEWLPGITHFVIALGDMPAIRPHTIRGLLTFATAHPEHVCQPSHDGRPGHPVVLPRPLAETIRTGAHPHLRAALAHHTVLEFITDDIGIHADIDTPADFHALKQTSLP